MRTLFVDTSAWCALYDSGDRYHAVILPIWQALMEQRVRFVTSDYVLSETLTLIRLQSNPGLAVHFGDLVRMSTVVRVEPIDSRLWGDAWDWFEHQRDLPLSFVDCTSFALMRRLGLTEALTLDRHFARAGFAILPGV